MSKWVLLDSVGPGWFAEVLPTHDVRPHFNTPKCPCGACINEDKVLVHNAFDGRDRQEAYDLQLQVVEL